MKKNLSYILIIIGIMIAGLFVGWKFFGGSASINRAKDKFMWGVVARPSGLGRYHVSIWQRQMDKARELGVGWVRITWDSGDSNPIKLHKEILGMAWENGMDVLLVIEPPKFENVKNAEQEGYDFASNISKNFKGQIKYYQVMNEIASTVLKGGQYSGENESDYDKAKYEKAKNWSKGAIRAIRENDPQAKIILTDQWTHFAFFDMIKRDGLDYDYLGWNWFSDMGFLGDKKLTNGESVFEKMKSFGKPIILTEVNYRPDDKLGQPEDKQSDFIKQMAQFALQNKNVIKGFFVHELTDITNTPKAQPEYYGIVKAKKTGTGAYVPGDPKKAFYTYQGIIGKN